jgi:hypothetical protein
MRNMSHIPEHPTIAHNGVVVDVNDLLDHAEFHSRPHRAVIRVYDAGFPSPRSARAMQDGVGLALLHFLQQPTNFQCGRRYDLDAASFRLR